MVNTVNANMLAKMFLAGAAKLEAGKDWINDLNVFPVPDGDTGTNMTLTIMAAAKEVAGMKDPDMLSLSKAISSGSLRGARGNSGVILSQLFRGFTKVVMDHEELEIPVLADALEKAVETAYKAVMKPKEGTILTVAKGAAVKARELADQGETDMTVFLGEVLRYADEVLSKTPDMLPVLKQAGVVDSGGQGLMQILKGAYDAFCGKEIDLNISYEAPAGGVKVSATDTQAPVEIKFGYCTEFIILLGKTFNIKHEMDFKAYLESIGDSIVVVADDEVVKVHVHTNDPGLAIQKALKYGALTNLKIDNMRLEHEEKLFRMSEQQEAVPEKKKVAFLSVSAGEGINEILKGLGVDAIIEGGQTMNPSTADMLDAIEKLNAETIFILPNNKNIILAAEQAAGLIEDKKVIVIPTRTIPQGITAVINYVPDLGLEENTAAMLGEIQHVKTGQVTYAVRDTMIDDKEIRQGDYMGIGDQGILANGTDILDVTIRMVEEMMEEDRELIAVYYGSEVIEEEAVKLQELLQERFGHCDVELQYGGQPVYYYIISVE